MNAEFLAVLEFWEREKGIRKDILLHAVEDALVSAAKKAIGPARNLRCTIDPKTGDIKAFAHLVAVEEVKSPHDHVHIDEARKLNPDIQLDEEIEVEVTPTNFGRIASQYAKQALMQQIRKAEKDLIFEEFRDRAGDIVSGTVRRFERSDVIIDLGRYEAIMPNKERVPTEEYQPGERIRCYVKAVENSSHGPDIILSRAATEFVLKLFKLEVSEINDGTIEVKGIAREPGFRTKIAVYSDDDKVDPVGACVGLRGQRVKNIVRELNNEKIDIINWSPDICTYIANALAPAMLKSFQVDEERHRVKLLTTEDQLSLAIGKRGQNARLTSKLTGWQIDIELEHVEKMGFDEKVAQAIEKLAAIPEITHEQANQLVHSGFPSLEELLMAEPDDFEGIPGLEENAESILKAVKNEVARRNLNIGETSTV
ncbi:MAG: transcription termination factor NusA [Verrucomicrobia bacterium]|nr:transcription termination factor NusA [Verrucomicrobiota bacterium]MCF7709090.1 transcription termination factor NusA [Verrucomicrobiota bacterium]